MKNTIILLLVLVVGCTAQPKYNQETINYNDEKILVGPVNWEGLNQEPYKEWFAPNYLDYQVDSEALDFVGDKLDDVQIVLFFGSWCEDSQLEVPQFYKILDYVGYDIHSMKVIALERKLEPRRLVSPQGEEKDYDIELVPTMIFFRDGNELGRITEYPVQTLEKDLLEIVD